MSQKIRSSFIFALLIGITSTAWAADTKEKTKAVTLEGNWQVTAMTRSGRKAPDEITKSIQFQFTGKNLALSRGADKTKDLKCTFTIDQSKTPMQLDILNPKKGKLLAIFKRTGNTLKICAVEEKRKIKRPTDFSSAIDSKQILISLELKK